MVEGMYYEKLQGKVVKCMLCPHYCIIDLNRRGLCKARINREGKLYSEIYGKIAALNIDPIEKKPLYHFYPKSHILSVGTIGCNLKCSFCQNYQISQASIDQVPNSSINNLSPEELVKIASEIKGNIGLAFTYNEPYIWYEYILASAKLAKKQGLKTVMVTNAYVNEEPLRELDKYIDAYSIDLKSYDNYLYKKLAGARIEVVLKNIEILLKNNKHIELDYLVIPSYNDDLEKFKDLIVYCRNKFGRTIVLHVNRYFPCYKLNLEATPKEKLYSMAKIAKEYLDFVYIGNI